LKVAQPFSAQLVKTPMPAHDDVPTAFLSTDQLQAIELMRVSSVPESGFPDELTIVEETEDERRQRERREAWEAAVAAREYSQEEEDVMEALLRHCLRKEFAAGVPRTKALSILGRKPSARFLQRFADEAIVFQFGRYDTRGIAYEIYKWQMAPPDRAACWLCGRDTGGMHIVAYVLYRKDGMWRVQSAEDVLWACGSTDIPYDPANPIVVLEPPKARLSLPGPFSK
jgi:hypothetical protein